MPIKTAVDVSNAILSWYWNIVSLLFFSSRIKTYIEAPVSLKAKPVTTCLLVNAELIFADKLCVLAKVLVLISNAVVKVYSSSVGLSCPWTKYIFVPSLLNSNSPRAPRSTSESAVKDIPLLKAKLYGICKSKGKTSPVNAVKKSFVPSLLKSISRVTLLSPLPPAISIIGSPPSNTREAVLKS